MANTIKGKLNEILAAVDNTMDGDAVAANVLATKTFFNTSALNENKRTGTMANNAGDKACVSAHMGVGTTLHVVPATGYTDGIDDATTIDLATVDTDLVEGNIKAGVTLFGVAGTANVVDTTTGDAVATQILATKKAWVDGVEVTGSATATALAIKLTTLESVAKKIVTIYLNQIVTAVGDAATLKAGITFAADGTTFGALGVSDTVAITGGSTIVVTFNSALSTATNKIKIAAGTVKDVFSINNIEVTTATINAE